MPAFDVVSEVDAQEIDNAVNQARKEIGNRYDFKGSKSKIEHDENQVTLIGEDSMKLKAMKEILNQKMVKRGIAVRSLEYKDPEPVGGDLLKQIVTVKQGITSEEGKKIIKLIKDKKLKKIQAQIQQDQVRVTGPKRDDLQTVIGILKEEVDLELQFVNFRD